MNNHKFFNLVMALIFMLTLLGTPASVTAQQPDGSVSGYVYEADGQTPIPNVFVFFDGGDAFRHGACTNSDGQYAVGNIPYGVEGILEAPKGFGSGDYLCNGDPITYVKEYWQEVPGYNSATKVTLSEVSPALENINFTLEHGGTISGTVKDATSGNPIPGMIVWVNLWGESGDGSIVGNVCSDASGNFLVENVPFRETLIVQTIGWLPFCGGSQDYIDAVWGEGWSNPTYLWLDADTPAIGNVDFRLEKAYLGMKANFDEDVILAWGLENGTPVLLSIDDPDTGVGEDYSTTRNIAPNEWDPDDYLAEFRLEDFDVQPGQIITVSADGLSRTMTVADIWGVTVDVEADTVSGYIEAGSNASVHVGVNIDSGELPVDETGYWIAEMGLLGVDIEPGSQGYVQVGTQDGGTTWMGFQVFNPSFTALFPWNRIDAYRWPMDATLTLTIDDPDNGTGVDYTETTTVGLENFNPPSDTWASFQVNGFELQPGQLITVTDGQTTKTHEVRDVTVTQVNPETDTITGTATPGAEVQIGRMCDESGCAYRSVVAGADGNWLADLTSAGNVGGNQGVFDIRAGSRSDAFIADINDDRTSYQWEVPYPPQEDPKLIYFSSVPTNGFSLISWPADTVAHITILYPSGETKFEQELEPSGMDECGFFRSCAHYLLPDGMTLDALETIIASAEGQVTIHHVAADVRVTSVNIDTDTISGTVNPPREPEHFYPLIFNTECNGTGEYLSTFDENGNWSWDVSDVCDLTKDSWGPIHYNPGYILGDDYYAGWQLSSWRVPNYGFTFWRAWNGITSGGWPFDLPIQITADNPATPQSIDFEDTFLPQPAPWDPNTSFVIYEQPADGFRFLPGFTLTLDNGQIHQSLIISSIQITAVDLENDTVSGVAEPFALVVVESGGDAIRYANASEHGNWAVDFSELGDHGDESDARFDIAPGANIRAHVPDNDGDITMAEWHVPNPLISVRLDNNSVTGYDWPLETDITLTIDDPATEDIPVDYSATAQMAQTSWGETIVLFDLGNHYKVKPNDIVTMEGGGSNRYHTVFDGLSFTSANVDTDTISGTASNGASIQVNQCDDTGCADRYLENVTGGIWTVDFSVEGPGDNEKVLRDLLPGMGGEVWQFDEVGNSTVRGWYIPNPYFEVRANNDSIEAFQWPMGSTIALEIDNPETELDPDYSETRLVDETCPWDPNQTYEGFWVGSEIDIQPGFLVRMTDGVTNKTHTITALAFTDIDVDTNEVSGVAAAGTGVDVWICDEQGCYNEDPNPVADGDGIWTYDFTGIYDIIPGTWVDTSQVDEDGDVTLNGWNVPNPYIEASLNGRWIHAREWPIDTELTLNINDPDTPEPVDYTATARMAQAPWNPGDPKDIVADFPWPDSLGLEPGFVLTITDNDTPKTLTISNLQVTGLDKDADTVSGTGTMGSKIQVCANLPERCITRWVTPGEDGRWTANYHLPGSGNDDPDPFDLQPGSNGWAAEFEADSDRTWYDWRVPNPYFDVRADRDQIGAWEWPLENTLTLEIDDPATPDEPDQIFTQAVGSYPEDPSQTYAEFNVGNSIDIQPGFVVSLGDGTTTKTLTVSSLSFTNVDIDNDRVTGVADPDVPVNVWACDESKCYNYHTTSDRLGHWTVDMTQLSDQGVPFNIVNGTWIDSEQRNKYGDSTMYGWRVPNPAEFRANVSLAEQLIWCPFWPMGDVLSLAIYDGQGNLVYNPPPESVTQAFFAEGFEFPMAIFYYGDEFEMLPGYRVVVSDGTYTKETIVTDLALTGVNPETDRLTGTAAPGSAVYVDAWGAGITLQTTAGQTGQWEVNFTGQVDIVPSTPLSVYQTDSDADQTYIGMPISEIRGTVLLDGQPLEGVEVWLNGPKWDHENYDWNVCTDENGRFVIQKLPPGPNQGFISATGPSGILNCTNAEFLDADGKPLLVQFWDHINGNGELPAPFNMDFANQPYFELQFDVVRAQAYHPILVQMHMVDLADSGACPVGATTCDLPLNDVVLKAYDRNNGNALVTAWNSGWLPWPAGSGELRYETLSDYTIEATYFDPDLNEEVMITEQLDASTFADRGDGVYAAPTLIFSYIKIIHADGTVEVFADSDSDNDGQPDLLDPCPADANNACDQAGSGSSVIGPEGGALTTANGNVSIQVPPGALAGYLPLSITDGGSGYTVQTDLGQIQAVLAVDIEPSGTVFSTPITITFHWQDNNNDGKVDGTNLRESKLVISKDGGVIAGPCSSAPNCNPTANTFAVQVSSLSTFVLGAPPNHPPEISALVSPVNPIQLGQSINALALFSDPDVGDTHTFTWNWGDGNTTSGSSASETHLYAQAGVYTLSVTVTDSAGESDSLTAQQFVVIYDPDGGYVTGGGWITSPLGAYTADPTLTGKATFGFVSKYQKGANIPTGSTEFQFHVANMTFKSASYDWLVVAGSKAQFKGSGTINGVGEYKFILTAIDGTPDKFRIKIWDPVTDVVVYDNQPGALETDLPATALAGGSIVIHK